MVGVPDPLLGQAVKAFLVVEGAPLTAMQVLAYCRAHLEDYMVPRYVEFVDEMPVTVAVDAAGNNVHESGPAEWQKKIRSLPLATA